MDGDVQGLDKFYPEIEPPFKKTKKKALDSEEKGYNQTLLRICVKIEGDLHRRLNPLLFFPI